MANCSQLTLCVTLYISILVSNYAFAILVTNTNNRPNTPIPVTQSQGTPKVLLIQDNPHNGLINYKHNMSYNVTNKDKPVHLSCFSDSPTKWLWKSEARIERSVQITKQLDSISPGDYSFISNMTFDSTKLLEPGTVNYNFSCSYIESMNEGNFVEIKNQLVTCVAINQTYFTTNQHDTESRKNGPIMVQVMESIPVTACHPAIDRTTFNYNKCSSDQSTCLELNTDITAASCSDNDEEGSVKEKYCLTLDTCESKFVSSLYPEGHVGVIRNVSHNMQQSILKNRTEVEPLIVYCEEGDDDLGWVSARILYPSFGKSLFEVSYHEDLEKAVAKQSIQILAYSDKELRSAYESKMLIQQHEFAENETVQFVCVAMKFLYMNGFIWSYEGDTSNHSNLNDNPRLSQIVYKHFLVDKRNITVRKGISWVSCRAPIWNKSEMREVRLHFNVSSPIAPRVKLTELKIKDGIELKCTYTGWPRPEIIWETENIASENRTKYLPVDGVYKIEPNKTWYQVLVFRKPFPKSVTCTGANFLQQDHDSWALKDSDGSNTVWGIILASILFCSLTVGISAIFYSRYRKKLALYTEQGQLSLDEIHEFYGGASNTSTTYEALLLPYNSEEYEISRTELIMDGTILGSGQFGLVLKGNIGPLTVAVKTIKPTADVIYLKSLLSELKVLQYIGTHPNIVNLIGAITQDIKKREVFVVLDYCSNGNLVNFLRQCRERYVDFFSTDSQDDKSLYPLYENSKEVTLTTGNLIAFAYEIAGAMDHIASKNIIHGDLAARNILVTEDLRAKVCDFGLAKQLLHYSIYVQKIDCPLPLRWMAPESLQDMEFSIASDRWSYGICLWEIFSLGELPYPGIQWGFESYKDIKEGMRNEKPRFANDSIYRTMLQCWNAQPQERPSFQDIIAQLKAEEEQLV